MLHRKIVCFNFSSIVMLSFISIVILCIFAKNIVATPVGSANGLGAKPPMGWNTWCTYGSCYQPQFPHTGPLHDVCNSGEIMEVANAMIENGMQAAGYKYINLDDCWEWVARLPNGSITWDPSRFPEGMPWLANWLHTRGFLFGIYISLGLTTCAKGGRPEEIPGSYGHYYEDALTLQSWGVDYVKADWCGYRFPNGTEMNQKEQTLQLWQAFNKTGVATWLNFHCDYGPPGPGPDQHGWCLEAGNSFRIGDDHHDNWDSSIKIIHEFLTNQAVLDEGGVGHWIDPDFLYVGGAGCEQLIAGKRCPGQSDEEYRSTYSIWALTSSSLIVSSDVRFMSAFQREILLNPTMISINQFAGTRTVYFKLACQDGSGRTAHAWAKPLTLNKSLPQFPMAVAVFNAHKSHNCPLTIFFNQLGIPANTLVRAEDVWQGSSAGPFTQSMKVAPLSPHSTKESNVSSDNTMNASETNAAVEGTMLTMLMAAVCDNKGSLWDVQMTLCLLFASFSLRAFTLD